MPVCCPGIGGHVPYGLSEWDDSCDNSNIFMASRLPEVSEAQLKTDELMAWEVQQSFDERADGLRGAAYQVTIDEDMAHE